MFRYLFLTCIVLITGLLTAYGVACSPVISDGFAISKSAFNKTCYPPEGVSGSPKNVEEAVKLINSLPKPVTIPCFLESLDRPLKIYAANTSFSAQPADGARSPRIFIFIDQMILSVVPSGDGRPFLEFSVLRSDDRSLKGELEFPIVEEISPAAPYDQIAYNGGTTCRVCHAGEIRDVSISFTDAFISDAIRPDSTKEIDLSYLQNEYVRCNPSQEPDRCRMLNSLFGFGDVQHQDFPQGMPGF